MLFELDTYIKSDRVNSSYTNHEPYLRGREVLLGVGRGQKLGVAVGAEGVRGDVGEDGGAGCKHLEVRIVTSDQFESCDQLQNISDLNNIL